MRSSEEAYAFLTELKQTLQFIEVSTCDMEKGHLRCDANVSVRLQGAEKLGTKAEVKNLNSFRFLQGGARLRDRAPGGDCRGRRRRSHQETRLYDPDTGDTASMRSKEEAHDYRYFPEPDLLPLKISDAWLKRDRGRDAGTAGRKRAAFHRRVWPAGI